MLKWLGLAVRVEWSGWGLYTAHEGVWQAGVRDVSGHVVGCMQGRRARERCHGCNGRLVGL